MAKSCPISTFFIIISVLSHFTSRIGLRPWADALPLERQSPDNASRLRVDPDAIRMASKDFGKLVHLPNPAAVLYPCSIEDIASLVKFLIETMIYAAETNHDETSMEASQNHM